MILIIKTLGLVSIALMNMNITKQIRFQNVIFKMFFKISNERTLISYLIYTPNY